MQIKDKIVLLTGGANGIGFAHATELLRNGAAHVAILDLANSDGDGAADRLNSEFGPGKVLFIVCDVTKTQELEAAFAKTVQQFGGLDIVINNAGIMDDSRWELMVQINYNAVVRGTLLGLQYMGKDNGGKGGTIINVASTLGFIPAPSFPIYNGTKHAVIGVSRSFAHPIHFERTRVRVLTLCPSLTDTQLISKSVGRSLDFVTPETVTWVNAGFPGQTVDHVARGLVHMIRVAENGSVWIAEGGEPIYEVAFTAVPARKNLFSCNKILMYQCEP